MSKIFVRERRHVGRGARRPRFAIIAVEGIDLKVFIPRLRKSELERIASEINAEIVYLPRGENRSHEEDNPEKDDSSHRSKHTKD